MCIPALLDVANLRAHTVNCKTSPVIRSLHNSQVIPVLVTYGSSGVLVTFGVLTVVFYCTSTLSPSPKERQLRGYAVCTGAIRVV